MHNHLHTQRNQTYIHSSIQHVHRHSLNNKYKRRDEMVKNTYRIKDSSRNQLRRCNLPPNHRPTCSLISQQHFHPQAGHDSTRNKGQSSLTHSQVTPISQAHTVWFIRPSRSQGRLNAKLVTLNTSFIKHTQPLILLSIVLIPTTAYRRKTNSSQLCEEDEDNKVTTSNQKVKHSSGPTMLQSCSWPQRGQNNLATIPITSATKKQPKTRVN